MNENEYPLGCTKCIWRNIVTANNEKEAVEKGRDLHEKQVREGVLKCPSPDIVVSPAKDALRVLQNLS